MENMLERRSAAYTAIGLGITVMGIAFLPGMPLAGAVFLMIVGAALSLGSAFVGYVQRKRTPPRLDGLESSMSLPAHEPKRLAPSADVSSLLPIGVKSRSVPDGNLLPLPGEEYLGDRETELGFAVRHMAWHSAWGRWYQAQQLAVYGDDNDFALMNTALGLVVEALMDGRLEAHGRTPPGISYEPIPRETWRLAYLQAQPNAVSLWKIVPTPRSGVDSARISRLLGYDSVVVDSRQFLSLFPTKDQAHDVGRRHLLDRAKANGVHPDKMARLL